MNERLNLESPLVLPQAYEKTWFPVKKGAGEEFSSVS